MSKSYHDVVVYVDGQRHRIADNYAYELTCTRTGGWQLWWHSAADWNGVLDTSKPLPSLPTGKQQPKQIGGEFHGGDFRIEVDGVIVCQSEVSHD